MPKEDYEEGICGKLVKSMYGTWDAAQNWEAEYSQSIMDVGFRAGRATPCIFYNEDMNIRAVAHVDDFTILGNRKELDWFMARMKAKF